MAAFPSSHHTLGLLMKFRCETANSCFPNWWLHPRSHIRLSAFAYAACHYFFLYYYSSESVSGIVCVFVVLVLERVRRWVCGLRCPADLSGHMRSICEVSCSVSVHTLQPARQLLALIVGKDSRELFATQPLCFHVRKMFNAPHFRHCIKA